MNCKNCKHTYEIVSRDGEGYARDICICEIKKKCYSCGEKVNQALLGLDGVTLEHYSCEEHGVLETFHYIEEKKIFKEKKSNSTTEARTNFEKMTPEWVKELIQADNYNVKCSGCKDVHLYSQRNVTTQLCIVCPKCTHPAYTLEK